MTIEDLLDECGGFGKYQFLLLNGIFIQRSLAGWSMMQMSYAGFAPDWYCDVGLHNESTSYYTNTSHTLKKCSLNNSDTGFVGKDCRAHRFDESSKTIINEWDLVCDRKWVKATITSIQMAGVLLGAILSGQLANIFGRKKVLYAFCLVHSLLNIAVVFSTSWEMFAAFRFAIGTGIGAILVVAVPYVMEFMPTKWRPLSAVVPHWGVGVSLFAVAALLLENWVYLHIACGVISLPSLICYFYVPESVRWLTLRGRYEEAEKVFEKIARMNGKTPPKQTRAVLEKLYLEEQEVRSKQTEYTYWDLFKGRQRAKISLIICYTWFMLSMVFYGISFGVTAMSGNIFLNIFLISFIDVPFIFSTFYLNNRFGRKRTNNAFQFLGMLFACACLVAKIVVPADSQGVWITGFSMASKVCLGTAWSVSQTWVNELYPTVIRSLGYGVANCAARVGGIVAPFAIDLDNRPLVAYAIIVSMVLVGIVLTFLVPETKGMELSDSLKPNPRAESNTNAVKMDVMEKQNGTKVEQIKHKDNNNAGVEQSGDFRQNMEGDEKNSANNDRLKGGGENVSNQVISYRF